MPSLAIKTILSFGFKTENVTSGSQAHPTECAIVSPMDLDMANPGLFKFLTQTLCGPLNLPLQSWAAATFPPAVIIRYFSYG